MSDPLERRLKSLWNHPSAKSADFYDLVREGTTPTRINVDETYFILPEGRKPASNIKKKELWKGIVIEIRTLPLHICKEVLVLVQWFWSKKDIEQQFLTKQEEIPESMRSALDSMGDMELCPSPQQDINTIECLYAEADIVQLHVGPMDTDEIESQTYIVEYFYRCAFDEKELTLKGHSTLGCGKHGCQQGWQPDEEEERYCYTCRLWFHTGCLVIAQAVTQESFVNIAVQKDDLPRDLPRILLDTAYQPAARGGLRHFTAGNIRMVTKARMLVTDKEQRAEFTGNMFWSEEDWKDQLLKLLKIDKSDEGNPNREQLILYGQTVYTCVCSGLL